MFNKLIAFGDSWTIGDCTDLIEKNLVDDLNQVTKFKNYIHAKIFKEPWPNQVANKLNIPCNNLAIPGNCNKSIITQIYDYHIFNKFEKTDLVFVLLSTWHRRYKWERNDILQFNKIHFENSGSYYISDFPLRETIKSWRHDPNNPILRPDTQQLSYDTWFDFITIRSFLNYVGVNFYIGWAFSTIDDFDWMLPNKYADEIKQTKNLIDSFINYCEVVNHDTLLHPNLDDHIRYANYIYNRIYKS